MERIDFTMIAKKMLVEMANKGVTWGIAGQDFSRQVTQLARQIEDGVNHRTYNELKRLGHLSEFQRVLLYDSAENAQIFLDKTIPRYYQFLRRALDEVRKEITDDALCPHAEPVPWP